MSSELIPDGLCQCGCGKQTRIASGTDRSKGWEKGSPLRFLDGHSIRLHQKKGAEGNRWKGGTQKCSQGYINQWTPEGKQYQHILIAEEAIGRKLKFLSVGHADNEVVHHINGRRDDNRRSNLLVCTHSYHMSLHSRLENSPDWPEFERREKHPNGQSRVGASGFKGVRKSKNGKWNAYIKIEGSQVSLGTFPCKRKAAAIYDKEALKIHGNLFITNKSMGLL